VRDRRRDLAAIALLAVPSYVVFASHWMWWGGPCPPGRFVIPVLALLAPLTAMGVAEARHPFWRSVLAVTVAAGLAISAMSLAAPGELVSHTHVLGRKLQEWIAFPCLPTFFVHRKDPVGAVNFIVLGLWIVPLLLSLFCAVRRPAAAAAAFGPWAVAGAAALLLWAGTCGWARRLCDDQDNWTDARSVGLLNVLTGDFARPVSRAGLPTDSLRLVSVRGDELAAETIRVRSKPLRVQPLEREKDSRRYAALRNVKVYPLRYSAVYRLDTGGAPGAKIGAVYVMREGGAILAESDVRAPAGGGPSHAAVRLDFAPESAARCDFYFSVVRGANVRCESIDLNVRVPGVALPPRP